MKNGFCTFYYIVNNIRMSKIKLTQINGNNFVLKIIKIESGQNI